MSSQNNSPSSQGKSTNHHSKSPKHPPKFNWEKGCQQVFNPKTQVHQMPNGFQKCYSESSYHEHSGYRDNASYLIRKQNKRALKQKMKDDPETGPSESKKTRKESTYNHQWEILEYPNLHAMSHFYAHFLKCF